MFNSFSTSSSRQLILNINKPGQICLPDNSPEFVLIDFDSQPGNSTLFLPNNYPAGKQLTIVVRKISQQSSTSNSYIAIRDQSHGGVDIARLTATSNGIFVRVEGVGTAGTANAVERVQWMPLFIGGSNGSWRDGYSGASGQVSVGSQASSLNNNTVAVGYNSTASGPWATSIGFNSSSAGTGSVALGVGSTSNNTYSLAGPNANAGGGYSTALGSTSGGNGSQAVTGAGTVALGGAYASGADAFAASITNNSSSYGSKATNVVCIGSLNTASSNYATVIGSFSSSTGQYSSVIGYQSSVTANYASCWGANASSAVVGKLAFGHAIGSSGDRQAGRVSLSVTTTDATPTLVRADGSTASATNQVVLPNDAIYGFSGTLAARNTTNDNDCSVWQFKGAIARGTSAASTRLIGIPEIGLLGSDGSNYTFTLTADTTNGALAITVTGAAATTIKWFAVVDTTELTG